MKTTGKEEGLFPLYDQSEIREKYPTITSDEVSKDAKGGTERMKYTLYDRLDPNIRDEFQYIASRVRDEQLDPTRPKLLWLHDTWNDPEAQHLKDPQSRERFASLVFVSNWQLSTYNQGLGVPYGHSIVMPNAIDPIPEHKKPDDGTIRLIYHTTPHRGLELLVPAVCHLYDTRHKDIHLDVYSGFEIYGPQRAQDNKHFQQVFDMCNQHPAITYHGVVDNDEVRKALQEAHIFAYPSIWPETSCIAALEAFSAGCHVLCPNFAALPETCANFAHMYQWDEDAKTHGNIFIQWLDAIIQKMKDQGVNSDSERLRFQKTYFDVYYNWDLRIQQWNGFLTNMLKNLELTS